MKDFLKRVFLNGVFNEAVLEFGNGNVSCQSLDLTTTLFSFQTTEVSTDEIKIKNKKVGISDLNVVLKFIGSGKESPKMTVSKDASVLRIQCGTRSILKYLISDPDTISTWVKESNAKNEVRGELLFEMTLPPSIKTEFPKLVQLTKVDTVNLILYKDNKVKFEALDPTTNGFVFLLGKTKVRGEVANSEYNAELLANVFKNLDWKGDSVPTIGVNSSNNIVITQEDNFWVLLPMA